MKNRKFKNNLAILDSSPHYPQKQCPILLPPPIYLLVSCPLVCMLSDGYKYALLFINCATYLLEIICQICVTVSTICLICITVSTIVRSVLLYRLFVWSVFLYQLFHNLSDTVLLENFAATLFCWLTTEQWLAKLVYTKWWHGKLDYLPLIL